LVEERVTVFDFDSYECGKQSMCRIKPLIFYIAIGDLLAIQILLGH
jgi:hypothetical protein